MIEQVIIERILEQTDIVTLIKEYNVTLEKKGVNYTGCCPFHTEKTASFTVSPAKQIYHCFGCGKGGNAIKFVMEYEKCSFVEAVKTLANRCGEKIEEKPLTAQQKTQEEKKRQCLKALEEASEYFARNLTKEKAQKYYDYAHQRLDQETITMQKIGYASGGLYKHLTQKGFSLEILDNAGLVSVNADTSVKDKFYKRLMFPIRNAIGQVVAFTGRTLEETLPKYINSKETICYQKRKILYGLDTAKNAIAKENKLYVVEGNMDCLTLKSIGINNVVALSGTALSDEQINQFERLTKDVYIIADTDQAGIKSLNVNAQRLIERQFNVAYVDLECKEGEKQDADSFFKGKKQKFFADWCKEHSTDYIEYISEELRQKDIAPAQKAILIGKIVELCCSYDEVKAKTYIEALKSKYKNSKIFDLAFNKITKRKTAKENEELAKDIDEKSKELNPEQLLANEKSNREYVASVLSGEVDKEFYKRYGFYVKDNQYFFPVKDNQFVPKTNFILTPIAHICNSYSSHRIYTIENRFGYKTIINLDQTEMISLSAFKECVESKGNFIFSGESFILDKLKEYLYEETKLCKEIEQLGWQKSEKFFAYGNGILYKNKFIGVDEYGLTRAGDNYYYLPAFSKLNIDDDTLLVEQKRFIHKERDEKPAFREIAQRLIDLYADNAIIMLCAYMGVLFKDIIVRNDLKFPIINVFGVKGSGKTEFCTNFMFFFGQGIKEKKLDVATLPAISTYVGQFANVFVHLDEYKNSIGSQKIEYLKGVWDNVGRTKINMDDMSKTITSRVDCGLVMSGQELCTADNALLNRTCTMMFFKDVFSEKEKSQFKEYRELAKDGLTYITNELLAHRDIFEENFPKCAQKAMQDLSNATGGVCETRLVMNWGILLASYLALENVLDFRMEYKITLSIFAEKLREQNKISKSSSEINVFWETVLTNVSNGKLRDEYDFAIKAVDEVKTETETKVFREKTYILYLNTAKVFDLYAETARGINENVIPRKSMKSYLENSSAYIGVQKGKRFKNDKRQGAEVIVGSIVARAMIFEYNKIGVELKDMGTEEEKNDDIFNNNLETNVNGQTEAF